MDNTYLSDEYLNSGIDFLLFFINAIGGGVVQSSNRKSKELLVH